MKRVGKLQSGFTIIEVLVVVIAVGILATIGISNYAASQTRARDVEREADVRALAQTLEVHIVSNNSFPIEITPITFEPRASSDIFKSPGETGNSSVISMGNNSTMAIPPTATRKSYLYIPFVNAPTSSIKDVSCGSVSVGGVPTPCDSFALLYFNEQHAEWRWITSKKYPPPDSRLSQLRAALASSGL